MSKVVFTTLILLIVFFPLNVIIANDACPDGEVFVNGVCSDASITSLQEGWSKIEPGGETTCAHDTPYAYWVHPGTNDNVMVYMQGGGGCWNGDTCRDTGQEFNGFYDSAVTQRDDPARRGGILDLNNPENPFKDDTILYIPVCTGDVHWGDNVAEFSDDVTMRYKGFVNAATALEWAYENVPEPDSVFVTGCSAGSAGSILHTPYIIERYPNARVTQLGDSLSLIMTGSVDLQSIWHAHDNFAQWIPALAQMQPPDWTMAKQFIATANYYPEYTFSQYNTVRDQVQVFYTYLDRSRGEEWSLLLDDHLEEIEANTENYRSFTPGGDVHCILPGNGFYQVAIDGVRLVDWVTAMANGEDVESLHCSDCEEVEIIR